MNTLVDLAIKKFSMSQTMSIIVFIIMCCVSIGELCAKDAYTSGGVYYSNNRAGRDDNSSTRKITIKSKFNGTRITEVWHFGHSNIESVAISKGIEKINEGAFRGCNDLKNVTIAEGVTEIGSSAFYGCTSLKSVTLPKSLKKIGRYAFKGCASLESISLPEGVALDGYTFYGCKALIKAHFSPNVKLGESDFQDCIVLSEVILPNGVKLGDNSFSGCYGIKKVSFPSDITEIPYGCFDGCRACRLSWEDIPKTVKYIGAFAFRYCGFSPNKLYISQKIGYDALAFSNISEVTFSDGVTSCGGFDGCSQLQKVTLPSALKVIEKEAFQNCKSLTNIEIPDNVEEIEPYAFAGCVRLKSIDLPKSLRKLGANAFKDCLSIVPILIPDSVSELIDIPWKYTFKNDPYFFMTPMVEIHGSNIYGNNVRYTRQYDMGQKYDFSADDFYFAINGDGETVTIVGDYFRCYNKTSVEIPAHVEYNGKNYTVTGIDDGAFASCYNLREITMPEGITSIGEMAFVDCDKLGRINLPESVDYIGRYAFLRCASLSDVHLSNQLTTINLGTFSYSGVENINLGNIEVVDTLAFSHCDKVQNLDLSNLIHIGADAFTYCKNIKILALPKIRTMEYGAFALCESIQHIFLSDSLTSIPTNAFIGCYGLISANLENVLSFGESAFQSCKEFYDYTLNSQAEYTESSFKDCGVNYRKRIEEAKKAEDEQQRAAAEAQRQYEKSQQLDRVQAWLGFATAVLNAAGQSFSDIAQAQRGSASRRPVPEYAQPYTSTSGTTASTTSSRSSVETKRSNTAMDLQNRNTEQRAYDNYSSMLCSAYYGTGFYKNTPLSKIKDWQNTMRSIRLKWVNKGYSFYQSSWETKDFSGRK
jgi:hypothetical protein